MAPVELAELSPVLGVTPSTTLVTEEQRCTIPTMPSLNPYPQHHKRDKMVVAFTPAPFGVACYAAIESRNPREGKDHGPWKQAELDSRLLLLLTCCVILDISVSISEPQFPRLSRGNNHTSLAGFL